MRNLRLQYRYLDLRRPAMQEIFILRHKMTQLMRNTMSGPGLPRGRDAHPGPEHARGRPRLPRPQPGSPGGTSTPCPQSPQLYKQVLMVAGFDRYFQVARCFRDEDLRATRQPEFTQLDVEMSFVEDEDVIGTMEHLVAALAKEFTGEDPRPPAAEGRLCTTRWSDSATTAPTSGTAMELKDIADIAAETDFKVFQVAGREPAAPSPRDLRPRRRRGLQPQGPRRLDRVTPSPSAPRRPDLAQGRGRGVLTGSTAKFFPPDLQSAAPRAFRRQGPAT